MSGTPRRPTSEQTDDAATQEVSAQVEGTMGAFPSMNLDALRSGLAQDVVAFEMDMESKPVRLGSRAEVLRWAEEMFAELKKMGASVKLDIHSRDCHVTSQMAYCTVEFDFMVTMPDGSTMSQSSRNSVVLRRGDDGWKWMHWHSSLSVLPAQPG